VHAVAARSTIGLMSQSALLAVLAWTVGLSAFGWLVGIGCAVVTNTALTRGLAHGGASGIGPAGRVTLTRATLAGGVAALVVDSFWRPVSVPALLALTVVALILDAVDGWVARRTATISELGARFDMEVDAFLILILSGYVARSTGAWVLAIGAARYAFVAAGCVWPWLRASVPPRYWGKVVAATQGIVLTVAVTGIVPAYLVAAALVASLALLAESFGREVWWLQLHRPGAADRIGIPAAAQLRQPRLLQRIPAAVEVRNG
jgi:phosphatidylglycerophosphate synthase